MFLDEVRNGGTAGFEVQNFSMNSLSKQRTGTTGLQQIGTDQPP